jgi:hypothetical protein
MFPPMARRPKYVQFLYQKRNIINALHSGMIDFSAQKNPNTSAKLQQKIKTFRRV